MIRLWRLATWAMLRLFFWFHFETIKDSKQYSQVQGKSLVCFFCCCSYPGEALFTSLQMGIISTVCVTSYWALLLLSRSGIGVPLKDGYGIWKTEEWLYNRCFPFFYRHLVLILTVCVQCMSILEHETLLWIKKYPATLCNLK